MNNKISKDELDVEFAEMSMEWYGWGSPIGLGLGLLFFSLFILVISSRVWVIASI